MPRKRKYTSELTKCRMNLGWHGPKLAQEAGISVSSLNKLEAGKPVSRVLATRYLKVFDANLNDLSTLPQGWRVEDKGGDVVLSMQ